MINTIGSGSGSGTCNMAKLFNRWYDGESSHFINELATHVMTKEQFLAKDPDFVVMTEVVFNANFVTFVPSKMPEVVKVSDLPQATAEQMKQVKKIYASTPKSHQFGHIMFVVLASEHPNCLGVQVTRRIRHQIFDAIDYRYQSLETTLLQFHYPSKASEKLLTTWRPILNERQEEILLKFMKHEELSRFILASYRVQTSNPIHKSHCLAISVEMGLGLGEIKRMKSFHVMKRKRLSRKDACFRGSFEDMSAQEAMLPQGYVLFPINFMSECSGGDPWLSPQAHMVPYACPINLRTVIKKPEKEVDEDIKKCWNQLLKVPFPKCKPSPNVDNFEI